MSDVGTIWPLSMRLMHWLNAALVVGALALGAIMVLFVHDAATRFDLTQTHKSIGVSVVALTALRLCLRYLTGVPKPETNSRALALFANAAHAALYILLLLLPLSGWLMVTSTPVRVPTVIFGMVELPYWLMPDIGRFRLAHAAHIGLAVVLATLIVLHIAAAFIHAWVWRDRTLARMSLKGS
jgi:cytochrome b561